MAIVADWVLWQVRRVEVDEHTGSRRGWTQWRLGIRTGVWYQESPIESAVRRLGMPVEAQWVFSHADGRDPLGLSRWYADGRVNALRGLSADCFLALHRRGDQRLLADHAFLKAHRQDRPAIKIWVREVIEEITSEDIEASR